MCLISLFIQFVIIGWMMSGFNVALWICWGTLAVCAYLIWVGLGGMALASMWVVGLMSGAAISQLWFHGLPRPGFVYIPMMLFFDWLFALGAVWQLGRISEFLRRKTTASSLSVCAGLFCLVAAGLRLGWRIYPYTLVYLKVYLL